MFLVFDRDSAVFPHTLINASGISRAKTAMITKVSLFSRKLLESWVLFAILVTLTMPENGTTLSELTPPGSGNRRVPVAATGVFVALVLADGAIAMMSWHTRIFAGPACLVLLPFFFLAFWLYYRSSGQLRAEKALPELGSESQNFGPESGETSAGIEMPAQGSAPSTEESAATNSAIQRSTGRATLVESIATARQEVQNLFELTQDLGTSLSLDETLSVFSTKLKRLVPYSAIAFYVRHGENLRPEHVSGENSQLLAGLNIPMGQGLSGWVAQNKKPVLNGNPALEPGYAQNAVDSVPLRSALAVPLPSPDAVVGVLTLYHTAKEAFTSDHLRIILAVRARIALVIENSLTFQQAESSSVIDFLTGLPNIRALFLQLDQELVRCQRDQTSLTVIVCDMDGFKQVNDRFGHLQGNRLLVRFAQMLKKNCQNDYVARMGGDEFVILVQGLTAEAAAGKIENLRQLVQEAGREICGEKFLSLSVGLAAYPENDLAPEDLLAEADRRLYLEKRGRPLRKSSRLHPRQRCLLDVEFRTEGSQNPVFGNVTTVGLGGCYVETNAILSTGVTIDLTFRDANEAVRAQGKIVWTDPGFGFAVQFNVVAPEQRTQVEHIMEFAEKQVIQIEAPNLLQC